MISEIVFWLTSAQVECLQYLLLVRENVPGSSCKATLTSKKNPKVILKCKEEGTSNFNILDVF